MGYLLCRILTGFDPQVKRVMWFAWPYLLIGKKGEKGLVVVGQEVKHLLTL
jgi:hypothetical protein